MQSTKPPQLSESDAANLSSMPSSWSKPTSKWSAILINPSWIMLILSAGIHAAVWLLLPNPLKQTRQPEELEVISIVPVVTLPIKPSNSPVTNTNLAPPLTSQTSSLRSLNLEPNSGSQASFASNLDLKQPPADSPALLPPAITPNQNNLKKPDLDSLPKSNNLQPSTGKEPRTTSLRNNPFASNQPINNNSSNEALTAKSAVDLPLDNRGNPDQDSAIPTNSNIRKDADKIAEASLNNEIINNIFKQYSGKIILRRIAPLSANVAASQREPDVEWIPVKAVDAEKINGKQGSVIIALLVAPDGNVEKRLMQPSGILELDRIASETVKGYYNKFKPLKEESLQNTYRYITIKYDFPVPLLELK